jgi:hypothetical protein
MHSAAHRGVTVVTVVTLLYASVLKHHHWVRILIGHKQTTVRVACSPGKPCPATLKRVKIAKVAKVVQKAPLSHHGKKSKARATKPPKHKR